MQKHQPSFGFGKRKIGSVVWRGRRGYHAVGDTFLYHLLLFIIDISIWFDVDQSLVLHSNVALSGVGSLESLAMEEGSELIDYLLELLPKFAHVCCCWMMSWSSAMKVSS